MKVNINLRVIINFNIRKDINNDDGQYQKRDKGCWESSEEDGTLLWTLHCPLEKVIGADFCQPQKKHWIALIIRELGFLLIIVVTNFAFLVIAFGYFAQIWNGSTDLKRRDLNWLNYHWKVLKNVNRKALLKRVFDFHSDQRISNYMFSLIILIIFIILILEKQK